MRGILLIAVVCAASVAGTPDCPPPGITIDGHVVRVVDGDTIVIQSSIEYRVRLLDCWCPESRTKDRDEKQAGLRAKARMQELSDGKTVRVHIPGSHDVGEMMTMGRLLGRVWLIEGDQPAELDLSSMMVSEGLATTTKQPKGKR